MAIAPALRSLAGRRELSNVFWLAIGEGSGKLTLFAANLYLARTLRPASYGLFVIAQSLVYYAWQGTDLGTTMYGIREVARDRRVAGSTARSLMGLRLAGATAGTAVALALIFLWPLAPVARSIFATASLYLISRALYGDFILKGLEKFHVAALGSITAGITFLGLSVALVSGPSGAPEAALLWSGSWLAGAAVLVLYLRSRVGFPMTMSFHLKEWLRHLRHSVQFALTGGLLLIYDTLPILLAGAIFGISRAGEFSATYRLTIAATGVCYLIPLALYPAFSDWYEHDSARFIRVHRHFRDLMLAGGLVAAVAGVIFAHPIVLLLLGRGYAAAAPVFRVLAVDLWCYSARFTYGIGLAASGNQRYYTIASMAGLGVLGATAFLAKRFGLAGLAMSVVLADFSVAAGLAAVFHRKTAKLLTRTASAPSKVVP